MLQGSLTPRPSRSSSRRLEVRRVLGEEHPDTLDAMNTWPICTGPTELDRSIPLLEEVLKRYQDSNKLGPDHPDTLHTMADLGVNYRDAGRFQEGTALLEQAWTRPRNNLVCRSSSRLDTAQLADTYEQAGQFAKAEPLYREALETVRQRRRGGVAAGHRCRPPSAMNLLKQQKYADAEPLLRECLKIREQNEAGQSGPTFNTKSTARRQPAGPEEIRRGRAAAPGRLRGDEAARGEDSTGQGPPDRSPGTARAALRRLGPEREGCRVEGETPAGRGRLPADVLARPEAARR